MALGKAKMLFNFLKRTYLRWDSNDPWARAATVAYYALFSLPGLLLIVIEVAGNVFGKDAVQGQITDQIGGLIGNNVAKNIEEIIVAAAISEQNTLAIVVGIATILFGATGVFYQLRRALNNIWGVRQDAAETILMIIKDRFVSLGMIFVIGLLLLISLVVSAGLAIMSEYLHSMLGDLTENLAYTLDFLVSFIFTALLFSAVFKLLPDAKIHWRVTLFGGMITSVLFLIGKYALGYYITSSNPATIYGGASSIILLLIWVYYTCVILFFGAEMAVQYAIKYGYQTIVEQDSIKYYKQEVDYLENQIAALRRRRKALKQGLDVSDPGTGQPKIQP